MTRKRRTRRALLNSVISLIICFSMLLGTTFAWFTDSVTSANNIIQSGNLDIELEYWNGSNWVDVEGKSDILTNTLWEPGVTEIAYLRVANAGSLAMKYQMGINIVSEIAGKNAAGENFKLSDHIKFGVVEGVNVEDAPFANREAAVAAVTDAKTLAEGYTKASSMLAKEEKYLALVVYMPTTVGNEANHDGETEPQINLGINVFATQLVNEEDSFGPDYDQAAPWTETYELDWYAEDQNATEFVISSAEDLAGFAAIVNGTATTGATTFSTENKPVTIKDDFAGDTVILGSDIDLNNINWTPIGNWNNTFAGTFDGNGKVISNLYINDAEGEGVGLFGVAEKATIKNVTIKNVDINAYSMVAGLVGAAYPATIDNCKIIGDVNIVSDWAYVAGIAGYCYYGTQVNGCSVVANNVGLIKSNTRNAVGGITAWLLEGDHKVSNCKVENLDLVGWTNIGGITGFVHYNNTIEGCSVKNVTLTKTRADGNPGIGLIAGGWSYHATNAITLKNNEVDKATMNGSHIAYSAYNELYGSEYSGATTANFVLADNTVEKIENYLYVVTKVNNENELRTALTESKYIVLAGNVSVDAANTITIPAGKEVELNLNGYTLNAEADGTGNREAFLVKGKMNVVNGNIKMTAKVNQGWNAMSTVFDVTAGGVLNIKDATIENLGGTDMAFCVHLNNWGEVTLNVEDSNLISTYCPVRVFNSGNDMNNVTIKNSTLKATTGAAAFWVHNYTLDDFGNSEAKVEAHKQLLNFDIFGKGNTFISTNAAAPIRYGMTNSVRADANGNIVSNN